MQSSNWFTTPAYRRGRTLALFTTVLAFVVILLGAYTRLTNAGLSCPDWPHCYGFVTAPHTTTQIQDAAKLYPETPVDVKKAWTEMTHRYFAGTEAILILILAFTTLFARGKRNLKSTLIGLILIALLSVQVMLGMLTVTAKLKPVIVLAHLLTGISILSVLWWFYLDLQVNDIFNKASQRVIPFLWTGFFISAAQITLGGWVSTHYAGLACIDLPYCNGVLLPKLDWNNLNTDLITIHMLHRIGALITAGYLAFLAFILFKNHSFRQISVLIIALIALQVILGILNIVWLRPVWIAMSHQATAIFILLTLIASLVKAYVESREYRYARRTA